MKYLVHALVAFIWISVSALKPAQAQQPEDFSQSVVKVFSGTCKRASGVSKGSGLLIQLSGRTFVLTSNHVIQNTLPANCHQVQNASLGRVSATHIASDWGMGLSLLEIARPVNAAVNLNDFELAPRALDKVVTAGYPFDLDSLAVNPDGQILSTESHRHFFANTEALIEVINAHGEYGMSGGAVFMQETGKFAGVLSHQALVMVEGKPTQVQSIEKSDAQESNHLLVIPASIAKNWVTRVVEQGQTTPAFVATAADRVVTNGVEFTLLAAGNPTSKSIGGHGDPVGIGGHGDPVGIGGHGDPVGIGGLDADENSSDDYAVIQVNKAKENPSAAVSSELASRPWWNDLSVRLLQSDKVYVKIMIQKSKPGVGPTSYKLLHIISLEQFFHRLLQSDQVIPLIVDAGNTVKALSSTEKLVHQQAELVKALITKLDSTPGLSDPAKSQLVKVRFVAEILTSSQWVMVSRPEIQELIEGDAVEADWNELFAASFQNTVDLMSAIRKMMEVI